MSHGATELCPMGTLSCSPAGSGPHPLVTRPQQTLALGGEAVPSAPPYPAPSLLLLLQQRGRSLPLKLLYQRRGAQAPQHQPPAGSKGSPAFPVPSLPLLGVGGPLVWREEPELLPGLPHKAGSSPTLPNPGAPGRDPSSTPLPGAILVLQEEEGTVPSETEFLEGGRLLSTVPQLRHLPQGEAAGPGGAAGTSAWKEITLRPAATPRPGGRDYGPDAGQDRTVTLARRCSREQSKAQTGTASTGLCQGNREQIQACRCH